ncbi:hypothetical protein [Stenotrophomonas sp.]|uniref:hypothetical protein n=1 Tax=Stenotrophomonas sp. TaxID=69392 RepID=UPI0028A12E3C|nr:hypothetical protein [Stenotrophomonas sp.]
MLSAIGFLQIFIAPAPVCGINLHNARAFSIRVGCPLRLESALGNTPSVGLGIEMMS